MQRITHRIRAHRTGRKLRKQPQMPIVEKNLARALQAYADSAAMQALIEGPAIRPKPPKITREKTSHGYMETKIEKSEATPPLDIPESFRKLEDLPRNSKEQIRAAYDQEAKDSGDKAIEKLDTSLQNAGATPGQRQKIIQRIQKEIINPIATAHIIPQDTIPHKKELNSTRITTPRILSLQAKQIQQKIQKGLLNQIIQEELRK